MKHITSSENWLFEIKEVRAMKASSYGQPYTATVDFKIVLGELYIESMLSITEFTRNDWTELENKIIELGFNEYWFCRYKKGSLKRIKKVIK